MPETYSIKKLFRYAFITSPFFGLFGAIPGFAMREFELQRTSNIFILITIFTLLFWFINISLVWMGRKNVLLQNNIIRILISSLLGAVIVVIAFNILPPLPPPELTKMPMPVRTHHHHFLLPLMQFLSINTIIFILIELMILKKTKDKVTSENEQLKLANLEAKNNQLRQQLHPHFLFNSLSTLRSLINRSPAEAENYLEQLAELLRFSTNNSNQSFVSLKEEVELCTNYLNMQRVRFGNALFFFISIDNNKQSLGKVPIYSLQLLVENAIKHNILTKEQPLFIDIMMNNNEQFVSVKNNLQLKTGAVKNNGIGLSNLSERYRMLNEEDIRVEKSEKHFCVTVKIIQDGSGNN